MLRLERIKKNGDLSVSLRAKEKAISSSLIKAFSVALSFHLFAFIIFQVNPFRLHYSDYKLPPARVDIDLSTDADKLITVSLEEQVSLKNNYPIPIPTTLSHPKMPDLHFYRDFQLIEGPVEDPFEHSHLSFLEYRPEVKQKKIPLMEIRAVGNLGNLEMNYPKLDETLIYANSKEIVSFTVEVDNKNGTIFWQQLAKGTNKELVKKAEKILKELSFKTDQNMLAKGEIEFIFASQND